MNWNFQNSYTQLPNVYYTRTKPQDFKNPRLLLFNSDLANELNLNVNSNEKEICDFLLGKKNKDNNFFSQAYAGHQFGHFTILGDGRAHMLGEHINNKNKRYDIQLKGSGLTPYSRNGDGKATLGPMIREYLVSEAMHFLNIPTTRALAVILTGENILRHGFQPGAILVRVAKSHIRVGTFQFGRLLKNTSNFNNLIYYTIKRLYPEIKKNKNLYLNFFKKICEDQVNLIIEWMRVGFIHGVMNTDNMSLSGETIDYGPCAFMDTYDPKTVFSSIDDNGRYSFENQSKIVLWNLARFAETILHLIDDNQNNAIEIVKNILNENQEKFEIKWLEMMYKKINLSDDNKNKELVKELLDLMHIYKLDYTNTFIDLKYEKLDEKIFKNWMSKYSLRKKEKHRLINPVIIPRNHIIEEIINDSRNENYQSLYLFNKVIRKPYDKNSIDKKFLTPPDDNQKVYKTFCGT